MSVSYVHIYVPIGMYGMRLVIVVLQEIRNWVHVSIISITSPSFVALHLPVSEIAKCIVRGCLLLFYKNYIVYYNVYCDYFGVLIEKHLPCMYQVSS